MNIQHNTRRRAVLFALAAAAVSTTGPASAQTSNRPVKFIVPTSPGSSADIGARSVGDALQKTLGRSVITENRVGAGGSIAAAAVAAAEPTGETIGILGNSYLLLPVEFPRSKFDPMQDVAPVAMISRGANILVVSSSSPYTKLLDIVQAARAQPGRLTYASAGVGSSTYHSAERVRTAANLDMVHVPLKGSPEALQEVMSGRVDFAFAPVSVIQQFVQSGRLRALATSASKRSTLLPNVPTTAEAGVPGAAYDSWLIALVPAKTPQSVKSKLNKAFNQALVTPEVKQRYASLGIEASLMGLDELQTMVRQEAVQSARAFAQSKGR